MCRLPVGTGVFRGLPFEFAQVTDPTRWIVLDGSVTVDLFAAGHASHLIVAHLCDIWLDDDGKRPDGMPVGHVIPVGEPLARYEVADAEGRTTSRIVRKRFECAFQGIGHLSPR